jgi:ferritin
LAEQTNTKNLLNITALSEAYGDYGAVAFLNPFHLEQIEAEDKVGALLAPVKDASPEFMKQLDYVLGNEEEDN